MGGLLTFLMGRFTLLMLRLKFRGSAHVLDRTSYVVDVTLKVLRWGGVGDLFTFLIRRLTLLMSRPVFRFTAHFWDVTMKCRQGDIQRNVTALEI